MDKINEADTRADRSRGMGSRWIPVNARVFEPFSGGHVGGLDGSYVDSQVVRFSVR